MDTQTLLDKQAIHDLQTLYSVSIDNGHYDRLDDVFTPDGTVDYAHAGAHVGVDAIKATCRQALEPLTSAHHQNGNHWAEIDGDTARAGCYFTVHMMRDGTDGGDTFSMGGAYVDDLVRQADGWRITRRALTVSWREGNPAVRFVAT